MKSFSFGRGLSAAATLLILAGCASEAPWGTGSGEGSIRLDLATTNDVTAAVPAVRAVSSEIATPPVSDFKVKVSKTDGSFSQTFSTVKEFAEKGSYSVGTYEIEAWYGEPESQGFVRGEDYEYAYYYGKITDVTVLEGQTTNVDLTASLANSVIVIEYTEAFKKYFTDWQTSVQTDGHEPVNLGSEEGMSYVVPGNVNVIIDAELQNGKTLKLNPATFVTEARHMYKMRYNVYNGEVGGIAKDQLVIEFDESLNEEPVKIDLTEELENTLAPVVKPEGFENGQNFVTQSGTPFNGEVKFNVSAMGGIKEAKLTIESDTYNPGFLRNGFIDLCQATEKNQADIQAAGIKAVGFFRNPGEMAQLDLTELCRKLPDGNHKFIFQVKDKFDQINDPVSVTVACVPVEMSMTAAPAPFGEGYVDVTVSYNGPDPTAPGSNPFIFRTENNEGSYTDSNIISITKKESTRAFESYDYVYRISVPYIDADVFNVRCYFGSLKPEGPDMTTEAVFQYPDYNIEIDPMSAKIRINVICDEATKKRMLFRKLKVYLDGVRLSENEITRDNPTGFIVIYNVKPTTVYEVKTTLQSSVDATVFGSIDNITTENAPEVPNGNFKNTHQTINEKLLVGGEWYSTRFSTHHTYCLMNYSEPDGWASVNQKTFYSKSNSNSTWYRVASTFVKENDKCEIRTVAYSHTSATPDKTGSAANTTYYNTTTPPEENFDKCSGELFLGSYSFIDGIESRNEGVSFTARPTSMTFQYSYLSADDPDRASVEVQVLAEDGTVLSEREEKLSKQENLTDFTVIMPRYLKFGKKASMLKIKFLSSTQQILFVKYPEGKELDEGKGLNDNDIAENSAHALAVGSKLTVTNLRFNYGEKQ